MRTLALCVSFLYCSQFVTAQQFPGGPKYSRERLADVKDDVIRNEIALFSINGTSLRGAGNVPIGKLSEIPLKKCSDKHLYFEKGNLYAAETIVSIHAGEGAQQRGIKRIMYVHVKYALDLPDSAIADIKDPRFCDKYTPKGAPIATNCKVFRSEDKKRVYIYMLNGEGADRYEVTWVVQGSEYLTRVIDHVGDL